MRDLILDSQHYYEGNEKGKKVQETRKERGCSNEKGKKVQATRKERRYYVQATKKERRYGTGTCNYFLWRLSK